jgi:hypothetical protein
MLKPDLVHRISAGYAAFLQPARTPDSVITRWRKLGGFKRLPDVARGARFQDGIAVVDPPDKVENEQQKIAA